MTDRLSTGQGLAPNGELRSKNGRYRFVYQTDGNIVLYGPNGAIWDSGTVGKPNGKAVLQVDGNFVAYDANGSPYFATNTVGHPRAFLFVQDDGNVVLYDGTSVLWNTDTAGGVRHEHKSFFAKAAGTFSHAATGVAKIYGQVTTSPIWKVAALAANAIPVPGLGTAISAGMLAAAKAGEAVQSKDGIVAAMASQLPGGDAIKAGFSVATGIAAQGGGMSGIDVAAVRAQLPATARAGFDAGISLHIGRATTSTAPAKLQNPQARAAYYATMGLVKAKAPKSIAKSALHAAAHARAAKAGAKFAAKEIAASREETWLTWALRKLKGAVYA